MTSPRLALDRSLRRVDADGHLHVEMSNISKANVCPYYGREIPHYVSLGLDANRVYQLYRDPVELKAAAASFAGKPLLMHHIPVTADAPATELVVGTVGTDVQFEGVHLRAPLSVWRQDAIDLIESGEQRELSPGYRYTADMTPGRSPDGVAFDGSMRQIMGNHVALVAEGRTGPDVVVADQNLPEFSRMKFPKLMAALAAVLPSLSAEHAVALDAALDTELKAAPGLSEDEMKAALDAYCASGGKAMDALTDEDKTEAYARAAKDKAAKGALPKGPEGGAPKPAMDEAALKLAVDAAVAKALEGMVAKADADKLAQDAAAAVHNLYAARKAVETTVGVVALDSSEAVYRFALDHLKVEHKDVVASALAALYDASSKAAAAAPVIATDAAAGFDIAEILGLSHIRKG